MIAHLPEDRLVEGATLCFRCGKLLSTERDGDTEAARQACRG